MTGQEQVRAWRPDLAGVSEVLHGRFTGFSYPMHAHDVWTLLIVDDGRIKYDLDRRERGVLGNGVILLPPHIPHNGCSVTSEGFQKRVLYLETSQLSKRLSGTAVENPIPDDPTLRQRIHQLHITLLQRGNEFEAESRLQFIIERLHQHLKQPAPAAESPTQETRIAHLLHDLLDEHFVEGISLRKAADILHAHPTHLVRAFSREFGMSPHQYVIGRRVSLARRLLLAGHPAQTVAELTGFYDQSHLARNFKRLVGTSPVKYARSGPLTKTAGQHVKAG
ncbi:MAG: AraC family transcriptional regulator [Jatrophihabitantaceae bacterium]